MIPCKFLKKDTKNINEIVYKGKFITEINKQLLKSIPEKGVQSINIQVAKLLRNFPNPISNKASSTGLMVGKVQSGKTSNFISLIALAFDNGYDIAIVFGGNTKNLLSQNTHRIKKYFENLREDVNIVSTTEIIKGSYSQFERIIKINKKIIIMCLKANKGHINKLYEDVFLQSLYLKDRPVLIVDDEGDQASLNAEVYKKRESATYNAIKKIRLLLKVHTFLSVTATPQANLLIIKSDLLSPDYCGLIYPGEGYCGLDVFHSEDDNIYVKEIQETEDVFLSEKGLPCSFTNALADFFVGASSRVSTGDCNYHSMLIHPSKIIKDHKVVHGKVSNLVNKWLKYMKNDDDIAHRHFIKEYIKPSYERYLNDNVTMPDYSLVVDNLKYVTNSFGDVIIVNSKSVKVEDNPMFKYNIYVGGDMLGRGLTIRGLAVTYIFRIAKGESTIDTLEQRARWFGYRDIPGESYLDFCRIYCTGKIKRNYNEIYSHEQDLWDTLENALEKNYSFKDFDRIFLINSKDLIPTRKSVAKVKLNYASNWQYQTHFQFDKGYSKSNFEIIKTYFEENRENQKILGITGSSDMKVIYDCDYLNVYNNILNQYYFPSNSTLNKNFIFNISRIIRKIIQSTHQNIKVDLVWIRYKNVDRRSLDSEGKIKQIMQGPGSKDKELVSKGLYYPGDKFILNNRKNIQLQIHIIEPKENNSFPSPVLVMKFPEEVTTVINKYVIREE